MPSVTYNAQSFAVDGRRVWILGGAVHYARIPPDDWPTVIARAREAGLNTIAAPCPWMVHEPRKGRFVFDGQADVKRFVTLCGQAGLSVLLRAGPYVGVDYDGGGLPPWLAEIPGIALREFNEQYLERATRYLRKLVAEVSELQVTDDGPILLVQAEHAWSCSHREQEQKYLAEIVRILRESGIAVPIINANGLWTEGPDTIDTWRGWDQMLANVRQLRTVQPDAPRVVSGFDLAPPDTWGGGQPAPHPPGEIVRHLAEILAAGGQPILAPFHGGTHFGFGAGQLPGEPGRLVTTTGASGAPLGEAGARTSTFHTLRRLTLFVRHFGHVLAHLDPDYHPVTLDPTHLDGTAAAPSIVPLRGGQGRVVFVFARGRTRTAMLLLDNGVRMPIDLGDLSVGWYVLDVDLHGRGRLDYANMCPLALVGRSLVVMQGPEKSPVYLSVAGSPFQASVPGGRKPLVVDHRGLTFVICNQTQANLVCHDDDAVYIGALGFDDDGEPIAAPGWTISRVDAEDGKLKPGPSAPARRSRAAAAKIVLDPWRAATAVPQASGESPRYASLDGPQTLATCGALTGYGWYRMQFKSTADRKRLCHLPEARDRLHLYLDGESVGVVGVGPGAEPGPFDLKLRKGIHTLVALADNYGRFSDGNDLLQHKGVFGHLYEVKALGTVKPKTVEAEPVTPFDLRGFIKGQVREQVSDTKQVAWSFTHNRQTPILVDIREAAPSATLVLNGEPIAYYAGASGGRMLRVVLWPRQTEAFKRGRNELRLAPDPHQDDAVRELSKHAKLYECVEVITKSASWAFAKWQPPAESTYKSVAKTETKQLRGVPCWWKTLFSVPGAAGPLWIDVSGLSKGQVYVNKENLGRYFSARADGKAVGPQKRLYLPRTWVHDDQPNELLVFDEHGFDASRVTITESETGEFEA